MCGDLAAAFAGALREGFAAAFFVAAAFFAGFRVAAAAGRRAAGFFATACFLAAAFFFTGAAFLTGAVLRLLFAAGRVDFFGVAAFFADFRPAEAAAGFFFPADF